MFHSKEQYLELRWKAVQYMLLKIINIVNGGLSKQQSAWVLACSHHKISGKNKYLIAC